MPKISAVAAPAAQIKAKTQITPGFSPQTITPEQTVSTTPTGQKDTNEVKTSEAQPLPPQYEALAKKESAIRIRENEIKAEKAALETRIQDAVNKALGDYRAKLKATPLDVLNEEGLTYDQLVEQAINQPDPKTRAIEQKLQTIEDNQRKFAEDSKKQADQQRQAAITQIRYDVKDLIDTDAQYETIKGVGAHEDVVELITRTFDETGKLLSIDNAAKMVEDELFDEAVKIANLGKVRAKLQPQLTPDMVTKSQTKSESTTLTNDMNATRKLTAKERAILVFEGKLKR